MKQQYFILILTCIAATLCTTSCVPNQCKQRAVDCQNGGVCRDGDCDCATGFEGDSCQNKANKKFVARYACVLNSTLDGGPSFYNDDTIVIKEGAKQNDVIFYSVRDSLTTIKAKVTNTTVNVSTQEISTIGGYYNTYGTGSLNNKILEMTLFQQNLPPYTGLRKTTLVGYKIE